MLTQENKTDMEKYIIFHLENLYDDALVLDEQSTLVKNNDEINMVLSRSLHLASESLSCFE